MTHTSEQELTPLDNTPAKAGGFTLNFRTASPVYTPLIVWYPLMPNTPTVMKAMPADFWIFTKKKYVTVNQKNAGMCLTIHAGK